MKSRMLSVQVYNKLRPQPTQVLCDTDFLTKDQKNLGVFL